LSLFSVLFNKAMAEEKKWDEDGIALEDTNVAGLGSQEDKDLRKKAAGTEPAWEGVGMEPGLWVWRIESFKVVPWPKEKYGKFHEGDSYIILHVEKDVSEVDGEVTEKLERDIHFWLGKKTSTDEKGTAAYKTVELDDFFDGEPTQHREVQKFESEEFQRLFPDGLNYLAGGVESGFSVTQQDTFMTKLYQVRRTKKRAIIIEEETVTVKSMNHRDAWILDTGRKIYTWFGASASPFVKNACNNKAEQMESERNGESEVVNEVGDDFWSALGGTEDDVTAAADVGEEVAPDFGEGILYEIQVQEDRTLSVTEVARRQLERSQLNTTGVMMVDTRTEIFLWIGKGASEAEKRGAFKTATNYLKMNGRNVDETAIHILKEGHDQKNKVFMGMFPKK